MLLTETQKQLLFNKLKKIMLENKGPLVVSNQLLNEITLIGNKSVPYGSKKTLIPGMYFASATIRKSSIAFYFFPIYGSMNDFEKIIPNTLKLLKGKTCFHFKNENEIDDSELRKMFKVGISGYKKLGWIH